MRFVLAIFVLLTASVMGWSQPPQLVILKGERVMARLNPGDDIVFRLKGTKTRITSYINNLNDTSVLAHKTLVPLSQIDRIYLKRSTYGGKIGTLCLVGGTGYFLIDQFNTMIVQGDKPSLDPRVTRTSVVLIAAGLPLILLQPKSYKIRGKYKVLVARKGSAFYRPDLKLIEAWQLEPGS